MQSTRVFLLLTIQLVLIRSAVAQSTVLQTDRKVSFELPAGLEVCEGKCLEDHVSNGGVGIWIFYPNYTGTANWPKIEEATYKLEVKDFTGDSIRVFRSNPPDSILPDFTATYDGRLNDEKTDYEGTVTANSHIFPNGSVTYRWRGHIPEINCNASSGFSSKELLERGFRASRYNQDERAFSCFQIAANSHHDSNSEALVGLAYRDGIGTNQNCSESLRWLKLSAVQDNYFAEMALGRMYKLGESCTPEDSQKAQTYEEEARRNPVAVKAQEVRHQRQLQEQLGVKALETILSVISNSSLN